MKQLSPEQQERIDVLYTTVEAHYATLRNFTRLRRNGLRRGAAMQVRVCDATITTLSHNVGQVWAEILSIVNPAMKTKPEEPAPEPEAATVPVKEWKQ